MSEIKLQLIIWRKTRGQFANFLKCVFRSFIHCFLGGKTPWKDVIWQNHHISFIFTLGDFFLSSYYLFIWRETEQFSLFLSFRLQKVLLKCQPKLYKSWPIIEESSIINCQNENHKWPWNTILFWWLFVWELISVKPLNEEDIVLHGYNHWRYLTSKWTCCCPLGAGTVCWPHTCHLIARTLGSNATSKAPRSCQHTGKFPESW